MFGKIGFDEPGLILGTSRDFHPHPGRWAAAVQIAVLKFEKCAKICNFLIFRKKRRRRKDLVHPRSTRSTNPT